MEATNIRDILAAHPPINVNNSLPAISDMVNNGIYPVATPPGATFPCLTYSITSSVPLDGYSLDATWRTRSRVTIDVFADTYLTLCSIVDAVHAALDGYADDNIQLILPENEQDFYLSDSQLYRRELQFFAYT